MKSSGIVKILTPITIAAAIVLIWNWQTLLWVVGGGIVALLIFTFIINQLLKDWGQ